MEYKYILKICLICLLLLMFIQPVFSISAENLELLYNVPARNNIGDGPIDVNLAIALNELYFDQTGNEFEDLYNPTGRELSQIKADDNGWIDLSNKGIESVDNTRHLWLFLNNSYSIVSTNDTNAQAAQFKINPGYTYSLNLSGNPITAFSNRSFSDYSTNGLTTWSSLGSPAADIDIIIIPNATTELSGASSASTGVFNSSPVSSIIFEENLSSHTLSIYINTFTNTTNLENLTFPNDVKFIGTTTGHFINSSIKDITFSKNVVLTNATFNRSLSLENLTFNSTAELFSNSTNLFNNTPVLKNIYIRNYSLLNSLISHPNNPLSRPLSATPGYDLTIVIIGDMVFDNSFPKSQFQSLNAAGNRNLVLSGTAGVLIMVDPGYSGNLTFKDGDDVITLEAGDRYLFGSIQTIEDIILESTGLNPADYTASSWIDFRDALDAIGLVDMNDSSAVTQAAMDLKTAYSALEYTEIFVQSVIDSYESEIDYSVYTAKSMLYFQESVYNLKTLLENSGKPMTTDKLLKEAVDAEIKALETQLPTFQLIPPDTIQIMYFGMSRSIPVYAANAKALNPNVEFVYVETYTTNLDKEIILNGGIESQHAVIFDMVGYLDDDDIKTELLKAQSGSNQTKLISIRGWNTPSYLDILDSDADRDEFLTEESERDLESYKHTRTNYEELAHLYISHILRAYRPDLIDLEDYQTTSLLYIGYSSNSHITWWNATSNSYQSRSDFTGTEGFLKSAALLEKVYYSGYFDKVDAISYGFSENGSGILYDSGMTVEVINGGNYYQIENFSWSLETFKSNSGYDPGKHGSFDSYLETYFQNYDIILFDGFFYDEMFDEFGDVFKAVPNETVMIFNTRYIPTVGAAKTYTDLDFSYPGNAVLGVINLNYGSLVKDPEYYALSNLLTLGIYGTEFTQKFKAPSASELKNLTVGGSGSIYHPIAKKYFETTEQYLAWHQGTDGGSGYSNLQRYDNGTPKPYIGIFGFTSVYSPPIKSLTEAIEANGYNVIVGGDPSYDNMDTVFAKKNPSGEYESYVTCLISLKNWAMNYGNQKEGVYQLENVNVPVIKVVGSSGWGDTTGYDANAGIPASTFTWMASASNVDGNIDFIVLSEENIPWIADRAAAWANLNATSNPSKNIAFMYYNYPPGKEEIGANYLNVMRSLAGDGAKMRVTAGDSSVPITGPVTYDGILRELYDEGYNVRFDHLPVVSIKDGGTYEFTYGQPDDMIMNEENLLKLVYAQGINVGSYAPGILNEMVRQRTEYLSGGKNPASWWGCELISVKDYLEWLKHETTPVSEGGNGTMSPDLYNQLVATWGLPTVDGPIPSNTSQYEMWGGMIWKDKNGDIGAPGLNYIVVPMIKIGDVRIMPEPNRALASDKALSSASYHSGDLPPTHQYVATYFWLNRGTTNSTGSGVTGTLGDYNNHWKADALIHFGTHGTQEWLPGTSVGLSRTNDWSPVLLPSLPNIYPYIVANVGEGLTAEYRGNALIISHMTPPMIKTQLYDNIIDMEAAVRGYQKQNSIIAAGSDNAILRAYRTIILEEMYELGWNDAFIDQINDYKREIANSKYSGNVSKVTNDDVVDYLTENKNVFDIFLENHLHSFIEAIKENSLSYGVHVYGQFDENQIVPMVWNMWSRQGFDDVLLNTYFSDVSSIPTNSSHEIAYPNGTVIPPSERADSQYDESNIIAFIESVVALGNSPTPGQIRACLRSSSAFDVTNTAYEDQVIYFLLGPSGDFGLGSGAAVVAKWQTTYIDSGSQITMYDAFTQELYEFYYYFMVPTKLSGPSGTYMATSVNSKGEVYVNDTLLEAEIIKFVDKVIANASYSSDPYRTVEVALSETIGDSTSRSWYNDKIVYYVLGEYRIEYAQKLKNCGDSEMNALINALSGGYIAPSSGNDPVLNPHVLPTGRNFYGIDPSTYPTPAAWKVGRALGEQLLIDYYNANNGTFPSTVSMMRFGVDFIQDEGTLEACLFYLLGCEPKWLANGVFDSAVPVTLSDGQAKYDDMFLLSFKGKNGQTVEIYRPRVDVVYSSAGMRDGYGSMLRKIDKAVKAVANLPSGDDIQTDSGKGTVANNIKKNVDELTEILKQAGLSDEQAKKLATARVFAQELGNYEISTGNMISASGNIKANDPDSVKAIADMYLAKMGYLYTEDNWGQSSEAITKLLQVLLGRTDASVFASAGNLYDSVDNDDVFQYFGVMNMVSSMYDKNGNYISDSSQWKTPQMFIADTSNIHNYKTGDKVLYTASEYIQKDMAARYMNPEWVKGQMEAGYSGAALMAEFIENLYGWSVISNGELVGQGTWDKVFSLYAGEDITSWLSATSPYALQSVNARMMEAIRTGLWDASAEQTETLVSNYYQSVMEAGMACCHHTCGNPSFHAFVSGQISVLGLTPEEEEQFWKIVKESTGQDKPNSGTPKTSVSSGGGYGTQAVISGNPVSSDKNSDGEESDGKSQSPGVGTDGTTSGTPVAEVVGYEMVSSVQGVANSIRDFIANPTFSATSAIAILLVVLLVGAIFYGTKKKGL